ncbi:MAG: (d)CMP kinase [Mycoplasma sp.]|nr:(d)CMP kinase [Mycoplasma sp.]
MKKNIAIDGPAGSGKSTIAKLVANKLGYTYISTGLMYRAISYNALKNNIDLKNEKKVIESFVPNMIKLLPNDVVELNGKNLKEELRTNEISKGASIISKYKKIRTLAVKEQQEISKEKGFVMDGRDITSVVLPNAEVKIFMWASPEERAKRRLMQNIKLGFSQEYEKILKEINERDEKDMTRENGPLIKVKEAINIDTTKMTIDEVVQKIMDLV